MRVISRKCLVAFASEHVDAKAGLDAWFHDAEAAEWANPAQIKAQHATASILKNGRVVFNICGNKYRLIVRINYDYAVIYIRFVGTHRQYDLIDAERI